MLDLTPFSGGSDKFYAYSFGNARIGVFTNGVKYIADECEAYWLIDVIMSYQTKAFKNKVPFQVWTLKSDGKDGAIVECEDGNENHVLMQAIEGLEISDGQYTIGSVIKPAPDKDGELEQTDFFAFSGDKNTDGHLVTFHEGYPVDYEIRESVRAAFDDERRYHND